MGSIRNVQELKALLDPVAIYGDYVRLQRRGRRAFGLCPFHREKTPSFSVDVESGLFYCFGCHKGGDLIQFIQEIEACTFQEAAELLAGKAGATLSFHPGKSPPGTDKKETLRKVIKAAEEYYRACLEGAAPGSPVQQYMKQRGIDSATAAELGLGYAPPGGGVLAALRRGGARVEDAAEAGLVFEKGRRGEYRERFRNRLMFPILDNMGRTVGFGGRTLGDDSAKYLNSPENPVFQKRDLLYGLSWTKDEIRKTRTAVFVEGYMDFLALYRAGFRNAAATLGTSLTSAQAALIKRYADRVLLSYDSDNAGLEAARRAILPLLAQGLKIHIVKLPAGKDPDECIGKAGAEAYRKALEDAPPFFLYLVEEVQESAELHTVEGRVRFIDTLMEYLSAVPDSLERQEYAKEIAGRTGLDPNQVLRRLSETMRGKKDERFAGVPSKAYSIPVSEQLLVKGFMKFPDQAARLYEGMSVELRARLSVRSLLETMARGGRPEDPEQLALLAFIEHGCHETASPEALKAAVRSLEVDFLKSRQRRISQQLKDASARKDSSLVQILTREMMAIASQVRDLERGSGAQTVQ
ncbi:MAG: DNA primase [Acidobacteriota bacterium]